MWFAPVPANEYGHGHGHETERVFVGDVVGEVPSIRQISAALYVGQPCAKEMQANLETFTPARRNVARIRDEIRQGAQISVN